EGCDPPPAVRRRGGRRRGGRVALRVLTVAGVGRVAGTRVGRVLVASVTPGTVTPSTAALGTVVLVIGALTLLVGGGVGDEVGETDRDAPGEEPRHREVDLLDVPVVERVPEHLAGAVLDRVERGGVVGGGDPGRAYALMDVCHDSAA